MQRLSTLIDFDGKKILHLFCGASPVGTIRIDINPDVKPTVLLDLSEQALPFNDDSFDIILTDPPYENFKLYCFVSEAVRVLKLKGFLIIIHWLTYVVPERCVRWACLAVTMGPNTRIRCCSIFRKLKA